MDFVVSLFQFICFRIYGKPELNRADYIVMDRQKLEYLNGVEKLNCAYYGYFNGLVAWFQEIAARTKKYWCPIKHAQRVYAIHSRCQKFLDYVECEDYRKKDAAIRKRLQGLGYGFGTSIEGRHQGASIVWSVILGMIKLQDQHRLNIWEAQWGEYEKF